MDTLFEIKDHGAGSGRGLFASEPLLRGTLIHSAPCLLVTKASYQEHAKHTVLEHYLFNTPNGDKLLALGYGSIFNHSDSPNVDYRIDKPNLTVNYYASKGVEKGEELFIYYGASLWFEDVNAKKSAIEDTSSSEDEDGGFLFKIKMDEDSSSDETTS